MLQIETEKEYDARIIKLSYSCPLYLRNPNCPLKEIRKRKLCDKAKWFHSLSLSTKKTIYQYHVHCYLKNSKENDAVSPGERDQPEEKRDICKTNDLVVNEQVKRSAKCKKGFSCLNGKVMDCCEVKECIFQAILYVKAQGKEDCLHQYSIGKNCSYSCPVRKEIYTTYAV